MQRTPCGGAQLRAVRFAAVTGLALSVHCQRRATQPVQASTTPAPVIVAVQPASSPLPATGTPVRTAGATPGATDWRVAPLGAALNAGTPATVAGDPNVAVGADGSTVVVWREAGRVFARRWSAGQWAPLGGGALNVNEGRDARGPAVTVLRDGTVVAAWREMNADDQPEIRAAQFAGGAWQRLGGAINTLAPGQDVDSIMLAAATSGPVLGWRGRMNNTGDTELRRWDGAAWRNVAATATVFAGTNGSLLSHAMTATPDGALVLAAVHRIGTAPWTLEVRQWSAASPTLESIAAPSEIVIDSDSSHLSVAATPSSVYLVASTNAGMSPVARWDRARRAWASVALPDPTLSRSGGQQTLRLAAGPNDTVSLLWRDARLRLAHFDGASWSVIPTNFGGDPMQAFSATIAVDSHGVNYVTWLDRTGDRHEIRAAKVERAT